jgi:tetratricopeptide (TPR) repeat protein
MQVFGNGLGSNDWGAQYASGPWYQFGELLGALAPLTALMALFGAFLVAIPHALSRGVLPASARAPASLAVVSTLGFAAACAFGPNLQYLRIMAPANPSYCLLAALGVCALAVMAARALSPIALPGAAALAGSLFVVMSIKDHALYADVVVRSGMQDLAARWLLDGIARRESGSLPSNARRTEPSPASAVTGTASQLIARSLEHCRREQWSECVATAQAALSREPLRAEAWNNAAVGYAGLRLWDDAERCAARALELAPDFQLARNNLAWVSEEKMRTIETSSPPSRN